MFDFSLGASDPNDPNAVLQTPAQVARQQALADALSKAGSDYSPIASPWQGVARLGDAAVGAFGNYKSRQSERAGRASVADMTGQMLGLPGGAASPLATALANHGATPAPAPDQSAPPTGAPTALAAALSGSQADHDAFIRSYAASQGVDPSFASSIAGAEGLRAWSASNPNAASNVDVGPDGKPFSFGDFQLNVRNGLGNAARAAGIDPADPAQWQAADKFAIDYMAKHDISPWKGDKAVEAYRAGAGQPGFTTPRVAPAVAAIDAAAPQQRNDIMPPAPAAAPVTMSSIPGAPPPEPTGAEMSQLRTAMATGGAAPAMAPAQPPAAPVAGATAQPGPQGAGAASPPPAQAPQGAMHANLQAAYRVVTNPWATPAEQQIAMSIIQAQTPGRPTWGVVGKDEITGAEKYGWVPNNPNAAPGTPGAAPAAAPAPLPQAAAPAAPSAPAPDAASSGAPASPAPPAAAPGQGQNFGPIGQITPQGETYLTNLAGQGPSGAYVANQARMIINGQAPYPSPNAAGEKPAEIAIKNAIANADPTFSVTAAMSRAKAIADFQNGDSPTSMGGTVRNLNTALGHAGRLMDSSAALGKFQSDGKINIAGLPVGDYLPGSMSAGMAGAFNGDFYGGSHLPSSKEYQAALHAYNEDAQHFVEEATKFYQGSAGTQFDREAALKNLSPEALPSVRAAAIKELSELMQTKGTELQRNWHQAAGGGAKDFPIYGPEAQAALARINGGAGAPGAPAASVAPPPAIAMLKSNPTPQMRAHFDEVFGAGAADKALAP